MIFALLKSKAGVAVMAVFFCSVFFVLSKLKHRARASAADGAADAFHAGAPADPALGPDIERTALLRRMEERARTQAKDVQTRKKEWEDPAGSYDEAGDAYRRRPVPEPIDDDVRTAADAPLGDSGTTDDAPEVPSLRIHGRKPAPRVSPTRLKDAAASLVRDPSQAAAALTGVAPDSRPRPVRFVPYGRLIKAELVITLESTQDEMPLIGLVVEPVYNNGKLVIPAGTELHSMARPDRIRDRVISTHQWRLVFPREGNRPNGRQLTFEGIALDREDRDGNGLTWAVTDGSYGLRGRVLRSAQTPEVLMLFAAEALKAAGASLMDRQQTVLGEQVQTNARNAGLAGSEAVLEHFAAGIAQEIARNGVYLQVPAGKEFYVYPRQVIDADRADIPQNIARVE